MEKEKKGVEGVWGLERERVLGVNEARKKEVAAIAEEGGRERR